MLLTQVSEIMMDLLDSRQYDGLGPGLDLCPMLQARITLLEHISNNSPLATRDARDAREGCNSSLPKPL